ncbi:hypothetical protein VTK26DRAFT_6269 [Humicola hyalothermophila]
MAVALDSSNITPPDVRSAVAPVLSALPGAAVSTQPPEAVLPLLTPILRQRVQLLSSASTESWIRLLSYDTKNVPQLTRIAQSGDLEPHPVSGEIEVDWDCSIDLKYRMVDEETLQAAVILKDLKLFFRLTYCTNDPDGGDGWRVGEVGVAEPSFQADFCGFPTLGEAEVSFRTSKGPGGMRLGVNGTHSTNGVNGTAILQATEDEEDDDDDYWARYDATPSRTPAVQRSPAPQTIGPPARLETERSQSAEDAYFARYDSVQPAMDNHDPDEEAQLRTMQQTEHAEHAPVAPPLGLARPQRPVGSAEIAEISETGGAWTLAEPPSPSARSREDEEKTQALLHPRPESSASSNGSQMVAKLEEEAEKQEQSEFGVRQHISRSIRSLFLLSRASGIDREEFERVVRAELGVLGMVEQEI